MKAYETLMDAVTDLKAKGYAGEFFLSEDGIHLQHQGNKFTPEQLEIVEYHRFEAMSYPGDNEILYALRTKDDAVRGVLICPYGGAYADSASGLLLAQLPVRPKPSRAA
jgi:hypothetical protein